MNIASLCVVSWPNIFLLSCYYNAFVLFFTTMVLHLWFLSNSDKQVLIFKKLSSNSSASMHKVIFKGIHLKESQTKAIIHFVIECVVAKMHCTLNFIVRQINSHWCLPKCAKKLGPIYN